MAHLMALYLSSHTYLRNLHHPCYLNAKLLHPALCIMRQPDVTAAYSCQADTMSNNEAKHVLQQSACN